MELERIHVIPVPQRRILTAVARSEQDRSLRQSRHAIAVRVLAGEAVGQSGEQSVASALLREEDIEGAHLFLHMIMRYRAAADFSDQLVSEANSKRWDIIC